MKIAILTTFGLASMGLQAAAQSLTLGEIVSRVESAEDTPNIDAAVATLGAVCNLSDGSELAESGGSADSTRRNRFHAASISKLLTATAIMQLRDEGALSLDDQVSLYAPTFSDSPIRIEYLLTHTSGLRDVKRPDGRTTEAEVDAYIRSLAKQRIKQAPGSNWRYADAGFNLLGRIIERVTGKSYALVMKERLLEPIGMQDSDFDLSRIKEEDRVKSYSSRGKKRKHPWDLAFLPSSGLQTTATDLALFAQAILKVSSKSSHRILSFDSLREMTVERIATEWNGVVQGYGWQLVNTRQGRQWRHAGGEAGFESLLTIYPEAGFGIAVLGNMEDWPRFEFEQEISKRLPKGQNICVNN